MTTTEQITPPRAPSPPEPGTAGRPAASTDRTLGEMVREALALVEVVPLYGPPAVLLAGPLVLLALMVAGAFTAMLTLVAVLGAAVGLVGLVGAILVSPYLLVRRIRGHRARRAPGDAHAPKPVALDLRRVVA